MRSESHEQVDGAMNNFWRKSALMITPMPVLLPRQVAPKRALKRLRFFSTTSAIFSGSCLLITYQCQRGGPQATSVNG